MATPTPLGRDALQQMLSPAGRVVIVNRSDANDDLEIVAAAIVRHDSTGAKRQIFIDLDLAGDESEWTEPVPESGEPVALIEVLLQAAHGARAIEAYLSATQPSPPAANGWEAGIRPLSDPPDPADTPIPKMPGFAAYLIPFE